MNRAQRLAPLIVVVAAMLAGVHAIDPSPVGVFYDDAHYVILGRALALGEGYRYINVPGAPAATHFPPGYPALLAVLWRLSPSFPENVALFKMVNAVLLGAVALGGYWMARKLFSMTAIVASLVALASTIAVPALLLSNNVISEILFLAVLLPLLVVAEDSSRRAGLGRAALLAIGAGVLCMIRAHAIVLMPALAIAYALHRRHREAAIAVATGVVVLLPWLLWVRHNDPFVPAPLRGQYGSYGAWLTEGLRSNGVGLLVESLWQNVITSAAIIARSFSLARHVMLDSVAVLAVLSLCVAGALDFAKRARTALLFIVLYLVIVLLWPFSPLRFIWGIWPLIVLLMIAGARYLWRLPEARAPRWARAARVAAAGAGTVALVGALNFNVRGYANAWWATVSRNFSPRIQPQLVWVTEKTGYDDVIVADDEGAVYLYTGRRAVPASAFTARQYLAGRSATENARGMAEIIRAFDPSYVVAWSKPTLDAATLLASARPPVLVQVDTIPSGRVFRPVE
ncbi:MAG: hypothetical protein WD825_01845 [Gemmatimonadaceae bacterium]